MEYVEAAQGRDMAGLRLALTVGVPGPWGESAKKVFEYKGIDYTPVAQYPSEPNHDLVDWTGIRNAPVAVLDDEPGRSNYQDIVALAERLKPEPALLPEGFDERLCCVGISNEICGEGGFGWSRRIMMSSPKPEVLAREDVQRALATRPEMNREVMARAYGGPRVEHAQATRRVVQILDGLAARLAAQQAAGSPYFVGDAVTACDIQWACFSAMLVPLPHKVNPMPEWLRFSYGHLGDIDPSDYPILLAHRDLMFEQHLGLPLDF